MKNIAVALQLYSLRDTSKDDFRGALKDAAEAGYTAIEFAGFGSHSAKEVKGWLDEFGLVCAGTHTGLETVQGAELKKTAEFMAELGSPFLIVPGVGDEYRGTREGALRLADELSKASEAADEFGARIGYHNHGWEFQMVGGRQDTGLSFPMQLIAEHTREDVILQLDTGNAQEGSGDPVAFLRDWSHRMTTLHLKPFLRQREQDFERYFIGEDDSRWDAILHEITPEHTQFIIIEQERYPEPYSPKECVARCLTNLKKL